MRLALFVLASNPGNFLRRLALPGTMQHWTLRSIQVKLIKIGAKVVHHARQIIFQMAEVAIPKQLFAQILARIRALAPTGGSQPAVGGEGLVVLLMPRRDCGCYASGSLQSCLVRP